MKYYELLFVCLVGFESVLKYCLVGELFSIVNCFLYMKNFSCKIETRFTNSIKTIITVKIK